MLLLCWYEGVHEIDSLAANILLHFYGNVNAVCGKGLSCDQLHRWSHYQTGVYLLFEAHLLGVMHASLEVELRKADRVITCAFVLVGKQPEVEQSVGQFHSSSFQLNDSAEDEFRSEEAL